MLNLNDLLGSQIFSCSLNAHWRPSVGGRTTAILRQSRIILPRSSCNLGLLYYPPFNRRRCSGCLYCYYKLLWCRSFHAEQVAFLCFHCSSCSANWHHNERVSFSIQAEVGREWKRHCFSLSGTEPPDNGCEGSHTEDKCPNLAGVSVGVFADHRSH